MEGRDSRSTGSEGGHVPSGGRVIPHRRFAGILDLFLVH